jgi:hypothetical protein
MRCAWHGCGDPLPDQSQGSFQTSKVLYGEYLRAVRDVGEDENYISVMTERLIRLTNFAAVICLTLMLFVSVAVSAKMWTCRILQ